MIWHIAFAVDDLEEGMARFGGALNLEWNPVKEFEGRNFAADGAPFVLKTRLTFATAGPCALELFEAASGTPYAPRTGTVFHHMGYWTEDVSAERGRLEQCGWSFQGGLTTPGSRAAFFAGSLGVLFEACNATINRPGLEKYYPDVAPGMKQPDQFR